MEEILPVLADAGIPDEAAGGAAQEDRPKVFEAVSFESGTEAKPLIEALSILRELNASGARNAPTRPRPPLPIRWQGYLDEAAIKGDATAYRHYWELCVLLALRDGLRSGDVFVPGSSRCDNPAAYLFRAAQWETHPAELCRLVGKITGFSGALPRPAVRTGKPMCSLSIASSSPHVPGLARHWEQRGATGAGRTAPSRSCQGPPWEPRYMIPFHRHGGAPARPRRQSMRCCASCCHSGRVAACCAAYVAIRNSRAPAKSPYPSHSVTSAP